MDPSWYTSCTAKYGDNWFTSTGVVHSSFQTSESLKYFIIPIGKNKKKGRRKRVTQSNIFELLRGSYVDSKYFCSVISRSTARQFLPFVYGDSLATEDFIDQINCTQAHTAFLIVTRLSTLHGLLFPSIADQSSSTLDDDDDDDDDDDNDYNNNDDDDNDDDDDDDDDDTEDDADNGGDNSQNKKRSKNRKRKFNICDDSIVSSQSRLNASFDVNILAKFYKVYVQLFDVKAFFFAKSVYPN